MDDKAQFEDDGGDEGKSVLFRYDSSERFEEEMRAEAKSPSSPLVKGMQLDLAFAASREWKDAKEEPEEELPIQESCISVIFDLPDGSQGESIFKLGQTVEVLKSFVESEYGIPMSEQTMYIGEDKPMMNPLSLLDFPEAKGVEELYIKVEGPLPSESRK